MKKVRAIYQLRSDFVHKSLPVKDLELVENFMVDAMAASVKLLHVASVYTEKAEFIRDLDDHRIAGPGFEPHRFKSQGDS